MKLTIHYTVKQLHDNGKLLWYKKDSIRKFIKTWELKAKTMDSLLWNFYIISEDEIKRFCKNHTKHAKQKAWVKKKLK